MSTNNFLLPSPILDNRELKLLDTLSKQYELMLEPSKGKKALNKAGELVSGILPAPVMKNIYKVGDSTKNGMKTILARDVFNQTIEYILEGYSTMQDLVSKVTLNKTAILNSINKSHNNKNLTGIEEVCLLRSYEISTAVKKSKNRNIVMSFIEGAGTGAVGFPGIPANLALSNLLYFRIVQNIAMFYGYDVKNDDAEMVIAGEIYSQAVNPTKISGGNELSTDIIKILGQAQLAGTKQAAAKGFANMIEKGGLPLALVHIRATANKAAAKALEKAGQKSIEYSIFKNVFEQIGRKLTLKVIQKGVPIVSAGTSAFIDAGQMKKIINFADVFYQKRFILEKEQRIKDLVQKNKLG